MKLLTIIPAKGTSTRLPHKNMALLDGKPLVRWTIDAATAVAGYEHLVVVSTDDDAIMYQVHEAGAVHLRRPPELCRDPAQMPEVALHALDAFLDWEPEVVCVLLPTSPFRTTQHIQDALAIHCGLQSRPNVVSVTDVQAFLHHKLCIQFHHLIVMGPPLRDPDLARALYPTDRHTPVMLNGALGVTAPATLRADKHISAIGAIPYVLDDVSGLDIDTPLDLALARVIAPGRKT